VLIAESIEMQRHMLELVLLLKALVLGIGMLLCLVMVLLAEAVILITVGC
jgi:hypothetical protein